MSELIVEQEAESLRQLQKQLESYDKLNYPLESDFLKSFLRAKKMDTEKSAKTVDNYFKSKRKMFEKHSHLPSNYKSLFTTHYGGFLKYNDSLDRPIIVFRFGNWDVEKHTLMECLIWIFFLLNEGIQLEKVQRNGVVVIFDMTGLSFKHITNCGIMEIKLGIGLIQDAMPIQVKEIHVVKNPYIFNILFSVVKPFVKRKLLSRVSMHGHDLTLVHKTIEPKILPEAIGGLLSDSEAFDTNLIETILSKDEYYNDFSKFGHN